MAEDIEGYKSTIRSSFPDQVTLGNSPNYWMTKDLPEKMKRLNPKMKIILTVTNPVCLVCSDCNVRNHQTNVTISFDKFIRSNHDELENCLKPFFYDQHLET